MNRKATASEFPPLPGLDEASRSLGKLLMEGLAPAGHTVTPTRSCTVPYVMLFETQTQGRHRRMRLSCTDPRRC